MSCVEMKKAGIIGSEVAKYFYEQSVDDSHKYTCKKCQLVRMQSGTGYTSLIDHLHREHPSFIEEIVKFKSSNQSNIMTAFTNKTGENIYGWMEDVILNNLPFSYVTVPSVRKHSKLDPISLKTFYKAMNLTVKHVEKVVAKILPPTFGIMLDGWSHGTTHYLGLYAVISNEFNELLADPPKNIIKQGSEIILLSMGVIMDDWHENMGAESHYDYIKFIIADVYDRSLDAVLFLIGIFALCLLSYFSCIGDNVRPNHNLADKLKVPHVGCLSHRLALWVKYYLEPYEELLGAVNTLMSTLRTLKGSAKLSKLTRYVAMKRNTTRWSSTYNMLVRFNLIIEHIRQLAENDPVIESELNSVQTQEDSVGITCVELVNKYVFYYLMPKLFIFQVKID